MHTHEVRYKLNAIFEKIRQTYPSVEMTTCRDGGSVVFSIPGKPYWNIIMVAPVTQYIKGEKIYTEINCIQFLKPGCVKFEDSYKPQNIVKLIDIENSFPESEIIKELEMKLETETFKTTIQEILGHN